MRFCRCYLLDAKFRITQADVFACANDDGAKLRGRGIWATNLATYRAIEVWEGMRRVHLYPVGGPHLPCANENAPRSV